LEGAEHQFEVWKEEVVAKAAEELRKMSDHRNGYNLKVFSIFVAESMFQTRSISDNRSFSFAMIPRLQDIAEGRKHWNWFLTTIGGLKCLGTLASTSPLVICASIPRHSVNHQ
jgi:hypothetical protein